MRNFLIILFGFLFFFNSFAQESKDKIKSTVNSSTNIGVVDMKKILAQSKAYQSLVDQFEDIRRKHRNKFTKQEDIIRDEESNLLKQKNVLSKEAYAEKVNELGKKINELKLKQSKNAKKFEIAFEKSTNKIQGALVDVLSMIANKNKLDLVLAKSQVILVGKDIDLTDGAIAELNKVLPTISMDK
jgi:Skp family chaperone for outer membrane proteins